MDSWHCILAKTPGSFAMLRTRGMEIHILVNISIEELYQKYCKKSNCFV